jgi:hypothetical protein
MFLRNVGIYQQVYTTLQPRISTSGPNKDVGKLAVAYFTALSQRLHGGAE